VKTTKNKKELHLPGEGKVGDVQDAGALTATAEAMQLHTGAEHFGNVANRGILKRGCSYSGCCYIS
jgi:hypothetical protein